MVLSDLIEVASVLDDVLLGMQARYSGDLKNIFTIGLELPEKELREIDHDLYVTQNGSEIGFSECEEVRAKIMGIDFVLVKKEE